MTRDPQRLDPMSHPTPRILIIGATSHIARCCARLWARDGATLFLAGRDGGKLEATATDLRLRGAAGVHTWSFDADDLQSHAALVDAAWRALGQVDVALVAYGTLADQQACAADAALTAREFHLNGLSVIALLTHLAMRFENQRAGVIGVITSVAGVRGRPSNYVYGSAKAAVSTFCEGLAVRLDHAGVAVTDIRPGPVATPMTAGMPLPAALVSQPERVARRIVRGLRQRRRVLYAPGYWWAVMMVIRHLPAALAARLAP